MTEQRMPVDDDGWSILSSRLITNQLKATGMSQVELAHRLKMLGFDLSYLGVHQRLGRGTFSAAFLLQALVASGASAIELPSADLKSRRAEPR